MDIKYKLEKFFCNYVYEDKSHTYTYTPTNTKLISVTTVLSKMSKAFNVPYWSTLKAFERSGHLITRDRNSENHIIVDDQLVEINDVHLIKTFNLEVTPEQIQNEWDIEKTFGALKGSYLHKLLENLDNRDVTEIPYYDALTKEGQLLESLQDSYKYWENLSRFKTLETLAKKFKYENKHLIPILSEYVIGDIDLGIGGRFDKMYYNELSGNYEIWDYKTDKKITSHNKYEKFKIFNIEKSDYNKYSLQTSFYKYKIEKNTDIKLGDSHIVHFDYNANDYNIYKCTNYTELIKNKIDGHDWSTHI